MALRRKGRCYHERQLTAGFKPQGQRLGYGRSISLACPAPHEGGIACAAEGMSAADHVRFRPHADIQRGLRNA
jgi:hypothetical protein